MLGVALCMQLVHYPLSARVGREVFVARTGKGFLRFAPDTRFDSRGQHGAALAQDDTCKSNVWNKKAALASGLWFF